MPVATSPFPQLFVHPNSGLSFAWTELHQQGMTGSGDLATGNDGVALAMVMLINWSDLGTALQQLLGYSYRDPNDGAPRLRRKLPWQNAYSNQLWVKNISSVKGVQLRGKDEAPVVIEAGVGPGGPVNSGPASVFTYAQLVIHFWRPTYAVRNDADIEDGEGEPQEWLRYLDKNWEVSTDILVRENNAFLFADGPASGNTFVGHVGQAIGKLKLRRRWYQIPEEAIFAKTQESTPNGAPTNLITTGTETTNPITDFIYPAGSPMLGCVNSPKGGGADDDTVANRFFGCRMGTLLYLGVELIPQPLQLPPFLMQIPQFANNEPISQVQYDVVFHFSYFDPPTDSFFFGHNLMPYSASTYWYPVQSQKNVSGGTSPPFMTPFQYADLHDLFEIL